MWCLLRCPLQGTHVTSGRCRAVVVGTGASTAIGKIRDAMVASQVTSVGVVALPGATVQPRPLPEANERDVLRNW